MTWSINIAGNADPADGDTVRTAEEETAASARAFIAVLPGVTNAAGTFEAIGYQDLMPTEPAAAPAAPTPTPGEQTPAPAAPAGTTPAPAAPAEQPPPPPTS